MVVPIATFSLTLVLLLQQNDEIALIIMSKPISKKHKEVLVIADA